MLPNHLRLPVDILAKRDEVSCGPTCLHAIYQYWGEQAQLGKVIARTQRLEQGARWPFFSHAMH